MNFIFNRRDVGYTIISRFEESCREFFAEHIPIHFSNYLDGIPQGAIDKAQKRSLNKNWTNTRDFLDDCDFPDLKEIAIYNGMYKSYFSDEPLSQSEFEIAMDKLYTLRNKIAHVKRHFSSFDLDQLLENTYTISEQLQTPGEEFITFTRYLEENPDEAIVPMPVEFTESIPEITSIPNNIPIPDYEYEGGFVGRHDDVRKLTRLLTGSRNVITISGAGGVGKTALALKVIHKLLQQKENFFDGIVWLSAKENRLSYLGIEDIEPTIKNYEELLDTIFEVMGFGDPSASLAQKEADIAVVFDLYQQVLIVIDNFETITDDRITNFIFDLEDNFPRVKILITSRRGLGQVERRHELKQLTTKEAVNLFRRIARDKRIDSLARIDNPILENYVNKVACYPLAIKWVIGQVAIGKDINNVINAIHEDTSDISKFSFEQVYHSLSKPTQKILCGLSVVDESASAGMLNYIADLDKEDFEDSLQDLILVSLIIPETYKNEQNEISTKFTLLSLTRGYVRQQLDRNLALKRELVQRLEKVQATVEEAERAQKQYKFSLANLGAVTEEERVAAMIAQNAFQKYQAGRYIEAVEDYKRATDIAPRFASLYRNWAVMEDQERHAVEADGLMRKASNLNPDDVQIWLTWGNIKRKQSKIKDALEKYQKAYELSPDDGIVLNSLGQAKARAGEYKEADALFREALNKPIIGGSSLKNEIINRSSIARNLVRWAETNRMDRDYGSAEKRLQEALTHSKAIVQLDHTDQKSLELLRRIRRELGYLYLHLEQLLVAADHFSYAIVRKPVRAMGYREAKDTIEASIQAGKIYIQLGDYNQACTVFPRKLKDIRQPLRENSRLKSEFNDLWKKLYKRERGIVKWYDKNKGFGFIVDEQGREFFVHYNSIRGEGHRILYEAQKVSFISSESRKGPEAKDVITL